MNRLTAAILLGSLIAAPFASAGADPVDLRDKKGVVDPSDLKKYDPPPPPPSKQPPPPERPPDVPPFDVKKSHEGFPGNNPTN